jgi:SulP family sulfate permease
VIASVTIASSSLGLEVAQVGVLPAQIGHFDLAFLNQGAWTELLLPAAAVAALAALESLLSAKVADRMRGSGETHDSNRELFGQGLANLVTPIFGGVAATAALARTAVNVRANAQSRLAALSHSAFLALSILVFAPLVGQIPLAALAGVLLATTAHMIKPSEFKRISNTSKLDALVLWATFIATIALDLVSAVILGVLLTIALRKTKLANLSRRAPVVDESETLGD